MKKKLFTPEEIQIICGEKLKSILSTKFGKSHMSFKYQRKTKEHIDLVATWNNHFLYQDSKLFLSSDFEILVEEVPVKTSEIYLVSLYEVTRSKSHSKVADFHKKNHNLQKFSDAHIEELLEKLNLSEAFPSNQNEDASEKTSEDESIIPIEISPEPEIEIVKENENEPRFLLGTFLSHLLSFEGKLNSPTISSSAKPFNLEITKDSHILHCGDSFIASNLGKAISWYIKKYFNDLPSVSCENDKIVIRKCSLENKNKKTSIKAFCFTPNNMTTVLDMQKRLHRISIMTKPVVQKEMDNFKITYPSKRVAKTFFETVSEMGWNTEVDDVNLIVFPLSLPGNQNGIEAKNIVKSSEVPASNPFETINMFSGTKAEAIDVLKTTVNDLSYKSFSPEAQQKIINALRKDWAENNPEAYALSVLDFLQN